MNWGGILLGAVSFAVIGAFHPLVIWAEYQFGKGCWPVFLCAGLLLAVVSLLTGKRVRRRRTGDSGVFVLLEHSGAV